MIEIKTLCRSGSSLEFSIALVKSTAPPKEGWLKAGISFCKFLGLRCNANVCDNAWLKKWRKIYGNDYGYLVQCPQCQIEFRAERLRNSKNTNFHLISVFKSNISIQILFCQFRFLKIISCFFGTFFQFIYIFCPKKSGTKMGTENEMEIDKRREFFHSYHFEIEMKSSI